MSIPIPLEWRSDVDQEAARVRDVIAAAMPDVVGEMMSQTTFGRTMANWGMAVAANIANADSDHQRVMRAWAWIETLESYR